MPKPSVKENRLAALRDKAGKTQQECADALGVAQSSYARREAGHTPLRRMDKVTLALLFGLTLSEAFPEEAAADAA